MKSTVRTAATGFVMAAMLGASVNLHADEAAPAGAPPIAGSRVRLHGSGINGTLQGTVTEATEQELVVTSDSHTIVRVARHNLTGVEVVTGRHRNAKKGAIIGVIVGAVMMTTALVIPKDTFCPPEEMTPEEHDSCLTGRNLFLAAVPILGLELTFRPEDHFHPRRMQAA